MLLLSASLVASSTVTVAVVAVLVVGLVGHATAAASTTAADFSIVPAVPAAAALPAPAIAALATCDAIHRFASKLLLPYYFAQLFLVHKHNTPTALRLPHESQSLVI